MKNYISILIIMLLSTSIWASDTYTDLSMTLLQNIIDGESNATILKQLEAVKPNVLAKELDTDDKKKAFWINIYNAHIQIFLKENPSLYDNRNQFFHDEKVMIAGQALSFDKIEHGIIRRSKNKYSMGFLSKIWVNQFEKKFRVDEVDWRIHFALNCGAKSCPAVAVYDYKKLNEQLNTSTKIYLTNTSVYDKDKNKVAISRLFSWFKADFGSNKGIYEILRNNNIIPKDASPSIDYKTYDWTMDLDNYIDLDESA